jgi:hypothetical protein
MKLLQSYLEKYAGVQFLEAIEKGEHSEAVQRMQLFREFLDHYSYLKRRFQTMVLLPQSFASSGPEMKT